MKKKKTAAKRASPAQKPPQLIYRGGKLLTNIEIFTVFWGDAWSQPDLKLTMQYINLFCEYFVKSPQIDQLQEYNIKQYSIGYGSFLGSIALPYQFILPVVRDKTIRQLIQDNLTLNKLPSPTSNTVYIVFTPPKIRVQVGKGISCLTFCGYHDAINKSIIYAVIPYPDCKTCNNGQPIQDAYTKIVSHELCESITDPIPKTGWYDNTYDEIGDICVAQTKKLSGTNYTVQLEWSNKQNTCI